MKSPILPCVLFLALAAAPSPAAEVTLTAGDDSGKSSFNAAGNWSNAAAPSADNDYVVAVEYLRTPADASNYTFAGDSLSLNTGGGMIYKGTAATNTYTIGNFVLNGGLVRSGSAHTQTMALAGNLTVNGTGSTLQADQANLIIDSVLAGSGALQLTAGAGSNAHSITFNAANTYAGNATVSSANASSKVVLGPTGCWRFAPGASGVCNTITGTGYVAFNGSFDIDLTAAGTTPGDHWTLVAGATLNETYGADFTIPGFTSNGNLPGLRVWTDNGGTYRFLESTGVLAVVNPASDSDGDGLPDDWEYWWFGNLDQTADGDPDGDGETNAAERTSGAAPTNRASTATDTDAEGLPDAWEQQYFGSLAYNAGADPDGDGFSNLQELAAVTDPSDPLPRPAGTKVRLVPLDDGNAGTSEFGYAGASAINTVAFVRSSLKTVGNQQFVTWYGRHQFDASAAFNNTIWIGRRTLGSSEWEVFRHPTFTANAITDGHDVISYGIDGEGYMHVSWGMHGDAFHYSRSTAPVTGTAPIVLGPDTTMTGRENTVTYPQFLLLPDGDLLFLFREGSSGNGDTYLNRYDTATRTWDNVHRSGTTQLPFIKGTGWAPNYNAYPNMPVVDAGGVFTLTWCWRYEPYGGDSPAGEDGYQTNNNFAFARSTDAGLTWQRFDATPYGLPVSRNGESGDPATAAEHIATIPEGYSLINQASMCLDQAGHPVIGSWWAPGTGAGNYRRQYMVVFRNNHGTASTADDTWDTRTVSDRTSNPTTTKYSEAAVRDLGRPVVVTDDHDRIIVAYRDDEGSNGLTIVHSLPKSDDPERLVWIQFDLTTDNLGNYEPIIDNELWMRERQLHFLYQASAGEGYTPPANTADRFSILEWDARGYFAHHPQPHLALAANGSDARITWPSEPSFGYRLSTSTNLVDWQTVGTWDGTGSPIEYLHAGGATGLRRFWRIQYKEGGITP